MPKANGTIKVQAISGEQFRYYVESWDNPKEPHLVDLMEEDGNGRCSCWDFRKACTDNLTKHGGKIIAYRAGTAARPNPDRTQCKHICAALIKDVPELYRRISRKLRQQSAPQS